MSDVFDFPERRKVALAEAEKVVSLVLGKRIVKIDVGMNGVTIGLEDGSKLFIGADIYTNLDLHDYAGLTYEYRGPEGEGFATAGWLFHIDGGGLPPPAMLLKRWSPREK